MERNRLRRALHAVVAFMLILSATALPSVPAGAQTNAATITGLVVDVKSALPISGANVVVRQDRTQVASTTTDAAGDYSLTGIAPGIYTITIGATGYDSSASNNVVVVAGTMSLNTTGTVTAVVPAVDPASQLATVTVSGAPPGAVPGDAIEASIVVGHVAGVIVPSSAIVQDPQSGRTVVFVRRPHVAADEAGFVMRTVVVRASDATSASIAAGLRPGEQVAAQGGYTLLAPMGD
jgi:hypothetical protein